MEQRLECSLKGMGLTSALRTAECTGFVRPDGPKWRDFHTFSPVCLCLAVLLEIKGDNTICEMIRTGRASLLPHFSAVKISSLGWKISSLGWKTPKQAFSVFHTAFLARGLNFPTSFPKDNLGFSSVNPHFGFSSWGKGFGGLPSQQEDQDDYWR